MTDVGGDRSRRRSPVLHVDVTEEDGDVVALVTGEVDVVSSPELRSCLVELVDRGRRRIVVDLTGVEFIDSSGLGVLVGIMKRAAKEGGSLVVRNPQPRIARVFQTTGLATVFQLDPGSGS